MISNCPCCQAHTIKPASHLYLDQPVGQTWIRFAAFWAQMGIPVLQLPQLFWRLCVTHPQLPPTSKHSWGWAFNRTLGVFQLAAFSSHIANSSASPKIDGADAPSWLLYPFQMSDGLYWEICLLLWRWEEQGKKHNARLCHRKRTVLLTKKSLGPRIQVSEQHWLVLVTGTHFYFI